MSFVPSARGMRSWTDTSRAPPLRLTYSVSNQTTWAYSRLAKMSETGRDYYLGISARVRNRKTPAAESRHVPSTRRAGIIDASLSSLARSSGKTLFRKARHRLEYPAVPERTRDRRDRLLACSALDGFAISPGSPRSRSRSRFHRATRCCRPLPR